ncbi:MAG: GntR family transcriptional regulator [Proteobacteria bacterium]|nr:GntR family transcriptional regulator [Pseudomonadota bacterium]
MWQMSGGEVGGRDLVGLIRPQAFYEGVADSIRDRIFEHLLPPGSPVDEVALARHYGVSRTPVREAIKVLVNEGLLSLTPHHGCTVAEVGRNDLLELLDVLELLDSHAIRQLALQPDKGGLLDLYEADAGGAWSLFCRQLRELLGNTPFALISRNLCQQLQLCLGPWLDQVDCGLLPEQRAALLQAMLVGDTESASRLASVHAAVFRSAVLAAFDQCQESRVTASHSL